MTTRHGFTKWHEAPHQYDMNIRQFKEYCAERSASDVTPLSIIDELFNKGLIDSAAVELYIDYAREIYLDCIGSVIAADDVAGLDDRRDFDPSKLNGRLIHEGS
jgi:hypothetical protein